MSYGLWAAQGEASILVCEDARLHDGDGNVATHDTPGGQAGWDLGLNYDTLENLLSQMQQHNLRHGQITRLAINSHGLPGLVKVEGEHNEHLTVSTLSNFQDRISRIREYLADGCNVLFEGCLMAQGDLGTSLLRRLSEDSYFRGCYVHGFTVVGAQYNQTRAATWTFHSLCAEPGMHLTQSAYVPFPGSEQEHHDFSGEALPWADETSGHRKTAFGGRLTYDADAVVHDINLHGVLQPEPDLAPFRYSPPPQRQPARHRSHRTHGQHQGPGQFRTAGPLGS